MSAPKKTSTNPFLEFDFTKFAADFKVPGVDVNDLMITQKKNLEAVTKASQVAFEGLQAVAQRQAEIFKAVIDDASKAARDMTETPTENPFGTAAKQADLAKKTYEDAAANIKELLEMLQKSNEEAVGLINNRFSEGLDELKTSIEKLSAK